MSTKPKTLSELLGQVRDRGDEVRHLTRAALTLGKSESGEIAERDKRAVADLRSRLSDLMQDRQKKLESSLLQFEAVRRRIRLSKHATAHVAAARTVGREAARLPGIGYPIPYAGVGGYPIPYAGVGGYPIPYAVAGGFAAGASLHAIARYPIPYAGVGGYPIPYAVAGGFAAGGVPSEAEAKKVIAAHKTRKAIGDLQKKVDDSVREMVDLQLALKAIKPA